MALLKTQERQQLEAAYQCARDKRTANKINIILLLDDAYSHSEISAILRLDESTVRRHEKAYLSKGLEEYLANPFSGGTCKLEASQISSLEIFLDENICHMTDEVIEFVEGQWGISYSRAGMAALLRRIGYVYKKPQLVPGKANPESQEAFIEFYRSIRSSMKPNDKIFFVDGVHPQFNTEVACGWIRKGEKRPIKSNTGRQRVNLNGAFDPDSLEAIVRSDPSLDAESTIKQRLNQRY